MHAGERTVLQVAQPETSQLSSPEKQDTRISKFSNKAPWATTAGAPECRASLSPLAPGLTYVHGGLVSLTLNLSCGAFAGHPPFTPNLTGLIAVFMPKLLINTSLEEVGLEICFHNSLLQVARWEGQELYLPSTPALISSGCCRLLVIMERGRQLLNQQIGLVLIETNRLSHL